MSVATFASKPTTISTSDREQQQQPQDQQQSYEDNDDDISLARFISRKSQVNQQMPVMYPTWMAPNLMTLQQHQQDPWKERDMALNDYYGHNVSYAHYQQLQYHQQQLLLQCQKQHQMGYNGFSPKPTSGTNHRSNGRKTKPASVDTPHDAKTRMSPSPSAPRVRSSTLTSSSSSSLASNSRRQRSSSPVPSLVDDAGTWRSSIYSHNSAASSSVKTTSDTTSFNNAPIHSSASSISSFCTDSNPTKPSLTKRIRGVFSNKQYDSYSSSGLRRSPSMVSVMTTNTVSSTKSSWTNLFRKSSKSVSSDAKSVNEVVTPASPASSIGGRSHRHTLQPTKNEMVADLPSPAACSSSSTVVAPETSSRPASLLSSSSSFSNQQRHGGSKPLRSSPKIDSSSQQDYFGLPSSRHVPRPSFLQHGSPGLRPSTTQKDDDDDDISTITKVSPAFVCSGKKGAKTRFNTTMQVHDTFGPRDYDRRCDTQVTCQRLTPMLALQIKQELNEYKLNEMPVHPSSRQYTQFFL